MESLERVKLRLEMILYRLAELKRKDLPREQLNEELTYIEEDIREFNDYYREISEL